MSLNAFIDAYESAFQTLMGLGMFTERQCETLASLRLAYLMYPSAFM